jgi:hypothetical protein
MGLVGITFLAWMIVRAAWQILTWAVLLAWLVLRGAWFLLVTLPRRAWRTYQANVGYRRLIDHLVTTTGDNTKVDDRYARRIDGPVQP